jgi:hypothetical protein
MSMIDDRCLLKDDGRLTPFLFALRSGEEVCRVRTI